MKQDDHHTAKRRARRKDDRERCEQKNEGECFMKSRTPAATVAQPRMKPAAL